MTRKILEFHITYICNHACIFCSEETRMNKYSKDPLTEIQVRTILVDRAKKWFNYVHFTWWEPTLFPNFIKLLKFAKKIWYYTLIWTNWTLFYSESFSKQSLLYLDQIILSVHWYNKKTCSLQTWDINHFNNFFKIISNINKYKKNNTYLMVNIVLNKNNYKDWIKILKFLKEDVKYDLKHVLFSIVAPEGLADNDYYKLVLDLNDFQNNYLFDIIYYCNSNNLLLRFFWLPICILWDKNSEYSNDLYWTSRNTIERFTNSNWKIILQDIYSPDNSRKRQFIDKCNDCKWKLKPCTGVFKKYLDYYDI